MAATRTHEAFENKRVSILDKHGPTKTNILLGNQKSHFNKNLRKQTMIKSRLKKRLISQEILVTLSILLDSKTWWQI